MRMNPYTAKINALNIVSELKKQFMTNPYLAGRSLTNEQIIEGANHMAVAQIEELITAMENTFGLTAAAASAGPAVAAAVVEEQTEFNVMLL